jgi:5-methylcytosine-specific restriction protein B
MAIWNGRPNAPKVLEAAQHWRQECLLGDGGIFSGESLWNLANLDEVKSAFLDNPIQGSDKFIDKLEQQVSACTPAAKRLAAEALWLLLLFVSESQMGPTSKRDRVSLDVVGCSSP